MSNDAARRPHRPRPEPPRPLLDGDRLPSWLRRAARTWLQAFLASFLASISSLAPGTIPGLEWWQKTLYAAVFAAGIASLTAVVSALQNVAEDKRVIPSLLKTPIEKAIAQSEKQAGAAP